MQIVPRTIPAKKRKKPTVKYNNQCIYDYLSMNYY